VTASEFMTDDASSTALSAAPAKAAIRTDFFRPVHCIFGLPFDAVTMVQAEAQLAEAILHRRRCFFSTPNLNFLIACLSDSEFRDSVIRSDLSVADGMPIVWLAHALGVPIRERVAGASLFELLRQQRALPIRVFFFGGPEGVAARATAVMNAQAGAMRSVGDYFPGFGSKEQMSTDAVIDRINQSQADVLVVALGAKRGQAWIEHNLSRLQAPVVSHLGAVVNFVAGTVSRAPPWVGRLGLEWLWRIKEEPTLWRRYCGDGVALLRLLLTRVLPAVMFLKAPANASADAPLIHTSVKNGIHHIQLSGTWLPADLTPLRQALDQLHNQPCDLELDLSQLRYLDSGGVGLLLLAYGHQSKTENKFQIRSASSAIQKIFRLHCAHFLLMSHKSV
jgi:N-acetylglucosaminyldiphosphoundecaprenol N-acetyl-beta-D-mannosaminyltransferase